MMGRSFLGFASLMVNFSNKCDILCSLSVFMNGVDRMERWKQVRLVRLGAGIVTLAGLIFLIAASPGWTAGVPAGIAVLAGGAGYWHLRNKERNAEFERMLAQKQEEFDSALLRTVDRVRHDWMNELQVLYGYLQLKKYDKMPCVVERIKMKAQQQSYLSKLGIPSLTTFLLGYMYGSKAMELEVELEEELHLPGLAVDACRVAGFIRQVIRSFDQYADRDALEPNRLNLALEPGDEELSLDFAYTGRLTDYPALQQEIGRLFAEFQPDVRPSLQQFAEEEANVTAAAPFDAMRKQRE
jgi:hypothetical protein